MLHCNLPCRYCTTFLQLLYPNRTYSVRPCNFDISQRCMCGAAAAEPNKGFSGRPRRRGRPSPDQRQSSSCSSPAHTPAFPIILQQNCTVAPESIFKVSHARRTWNLEILCDRFDILRSLASSFKHGLDLASQAALAPAACSDFLVPWHSKHQQPSHRGMI